MSVTSPARHHAEWLGLLDISGPFLSLPTLLRIFPQGLEAHDSELAAELRILYEQWLEDGRKDRAIHRAWIRVVLERALGMTPSDLAEGQRLPVHLQAAGEGGDIVVPDLALVAPDGSHSLVVLVFPPEQHLERPVVGRTWLASPAERTRQLLRHTGVRLGLATNGEQWMLVHAPPADTVTYATFTADLWFEEPITLRAFHSLLGLRRLVGVPDDETLAALLAASKDDQYAITDQLGAQVRQAVEVLLQTLDRIDRDHHRQYLAHRTPAEVYGAAVTVMMRLVFLFSAEERGLLLLKDDLYQRHYAVSTLYDQLQAQADRNGEELLGLRHDAWARLLATFRAVYGGMGHDRLRLPAYGSTLFDPDRFPFLEGRAPKSVWADADPLPVDNRTVLHLLRALQRLEVALPGGPAESRRLSYRGLTVEEIGRVYEGLLDHTAARAAAPVLGLRGGKGREPEVALDVLESLPAAELPTWLKDQTGRSPEALTRALAVIPDTDELGALARACEHDPALTARARPFYGLLRRDSRNQPVVYPTGALYMTQGSDRRSTGTHYTPTSLSEPVVQHALEPLVYVGPAEGAPRTAWRLRPAAEILRLRVLDPAMGSGAFLVQACRYLADRLVEAWAAAEAASGGCLITPEGACATGDPRENPFPTDREERRIVARRIVADRCLFGVDKNPLAVEMAKLSLWLETLRKDRAFNYLGHALVPGDSLLGVVHPHQLAHVHIHPPQGGEPAPDLMRYSFGPVVRAAFTRAIALRNELELLQVDDIHHARLKEEKARAARVALDEVRTLADLIVGTALRTASRPKSREIDFPALAVLAGDVLCRTDDKAARAQGFKELADAAALRLGEHAGVPRQPFHWALEFPEILDPESPVPNSGFDAIVGNPPFQGGQRITGALGTDYRDHLVLDLADGRRGSADLCAYFLLRNTSLLREPGQIGVIATNTIAQGDTREVGLDALTAGPLSLTRAVPSMPWPGSANLEVSLLWLRRGPWHGERVLDENPVPAITPGLTVPGKAQGNPYPLKANEDRSFIGSYVLGMGFIMSPDEAQALIAANPKNKDVLFPYLNGEDLNTTFDQSATRWVINFRDWPLDRSSAPENYKGPVAADYPDCLAIVREKVKPEREKVTFSKHAKDHWWQYERLRSELYRRISESPCAFARARIANIHSVCRLVSPAVYNEKVVVFPAGDEGMLGVLQSVAHEVWARLYSSTLRTDMQYTPSDCFETFPFPEIREPSVSALSKRYEAHRQTVMQGSRLGLTKTYNRFHDPDERDEDIAELRRLHVELDRAVVRAYGWDDLEARLEHGFHETRQGIRFTVSEAARRELLDRLLALNHERYADEVAAGLHDERRAARSGSAAEASKMPSKRRAATTPASDPSPSSDQGAPAEPSPKPGKRPRKQPPPPDRPLAPQADPNNQMDFLARLAASPPGAPAQAASPSPRSPADRLLAALQAAPEPRAKAELLAAAGLTDDLWPAALADLKRRGVLATEGSGRGTRYRLTKNPV